MLKYPRILSLLVILNDLSVVKPASQWTKDTDVLEFRGYDIKGFRISYFGDRYKPDNDYTGILFYDIGSCTRRVAGVCGQMRPGYVMIVNDEKLIEKRDSGRVSSLGGAILNGFFKRKPASWLIRLVTQYDVQMAMFSIKNGVLSTKLSTKVLRTEVDDSADMNAYEYALLDTLNSQWQKFGLSESHWVKDLQKVIEERSPEMLEALAELDQAAEFKDEYAPQASWPNSKEDYYPLRAIARIGADGFQDDKDSCYGTLEFTQTSEDSTTVKYKLDNCPSEGQHKIDIHEFGDVYDVCGCAASGDRYNPFNAESDVVIIDANESGEGIFTSAYIKLDGDNSVIGRAVVMPFNKGKERACGRIDNVYPLKAIARLAKDGFQDDKDNCYGTVEFTQHTAHNTTMKYNFDYCPEGLHSIDIHEHGDVYDVCGCAAAGDPYNPFNAQDYVGNMGMVDINNYMAGEGVFTSAYVKLDGEYSVIGKAVVMPFTDGGKTEKTCGAIEAVEKKSNP